MKAQTTLELLAPLALALAATGCGADGVDGEWASIKTVPSQRNHMSVLEDGTSSAELWVVFVANQQTQAAKYSFTANWLEDVEDHPRFSMRCTTSPFGECEGDDFEMRCTLDAEAAGMSCTGDETWADYQLDWRRIEEE
jgi:hypothetical protein